MAYVLPLWIQLLYSDDTSTLLIENLSMLIYVLVLEMIQSHIRNFWLYLGAHVTGMTIMWFALMDSVGRISRLLVCAGLLICALYARIHVTHLAYPAAGWLVVGVLMVMTGEQMELRDLVTAGYLTEIISALLFVLYHNSISLEQALGHTKGAGDVPYDKVQQTNIVIMTLWLLLAGALILVMTLTGVGEMIYDTLGQWGVWMAQQFVRFLGWFVGLFPSADAYEQTASTVDQFGQGTLRGSTSILIIILTAIWETILAFYRLIGIIAIAYGIVYLCKWLYSSFQSAALEERVHLTWKRSHERDIVAGNDRKRRLSPFDLTPAARIRRAYINFLKREEGFRYIQSSMTPEEQMTVAVNNESVRLVRQEDAFREIRLLYEKARYQPFRCSLQDVRAMRQAIQSVRIRL